MTFKEGMIVRITCENFLTYDRIECNPGPKLNMIIGPNGTGKSSIVNAIALGLGGKTSVIGRAKQLSAYVKRGCKRAKIEIELYNKGCNYSISRIFSVDNKNSWMVNGKQVSLKEVEDILMKSNIQINNLCQFLPQDRVQDFAKMDSKQLLENTLKTVAGSEVVDLHESLKELRDKETQLDARICQKRKQLESEKKKVTRLEIEVEAVKEREEALEAVKMVEKKKAWVEFNCVESQQKEVLQERARILEFKKSAEKDIVPYEKQIHDIKDRMKLIEKFINKEFKLCGEHTEALRRKFDILSNTDDQIHSINNELQRKIDINKKRALKISTLEEEIRKLEAVISPEKEAQLEREVKRLHPQLSLKVGEVSQLQTKLLEAEEKMAESARSKSRLESTLQREKNEANKKKQTLLQRFPDTYSAYEWLENNRDQFHSNIYGPILMEIKCEDKMAKYVEFAIPIRDLTAFVCEDKNDMNKFLRTVRDQMGHRINVVQATKNSNRPVKDNFKPHIPIKNLQHLGFQSYIIDEVTGPHAVLNYLCQNYNLHLIPIGTNKTNKLQDQIPDTIRSYFSDSHHYSVKFSKYSGEKSSRIISVKESVYLAGSINHDLIAQCKQSLVKEVEILNKISVFQTEQKRVLETAEQQLNALRSQKRNLDQELQSLRTGRTKLKMRKDELNCFSREGEIDPEMEKLKANKNINKLIVAVCKDQAIVKGHLKDYQDSLVKNLHNRLKLTSEQMMLEKVQQDSMEAVKRLNKYKELFTEVEERVQEIQMQCKRTKAIALKMTDGLSPNNEDFKRKYELKFASLPNDVVALEAEISQLAARADCLAGGRKSVIEEYEKTMKIIQGLEIEVANPEGKMQEIKNEMVQKSAVWKPMVLQLISRINENFTSFFSQMKCVGEVSLEQPKNEAEYSKYGICVKVQFRENSKLQQLGPHTQSGGERAVATAIYMLSLQELTIVPFRCVDEINQGMDEHNERMVFNLMLETVKKADSAQCFLLTPKLLHGLEYSEDVRVLCIYNGTSFPSHREIKLDGHRNRKSIKARKRAHSDSD